MSEYLERTEEMGPSTHAGWPEVNIFSYGTRVAVAAVSVPDLFRGRSAAEPMPRQANVLSDFPMLIQIMPSIQLDATIANCCIPSNR